MGFNDLALISPVDSKVLNRHKVIQRASGAKDVLQNANIYKSLEEAINDHGSTIICGTGMHFDMYQTRIKREYEEPRMFFDNLLQQQSNEDIESIQLALIFGSESSGMLESDMDKCNIMLGIPTNPKFGSLNLSSAVQLSYLVNMSVKAHLTI